MGFLWTKYLNVEAFLGAKIFECMHSSYFAYACIVHQLDPENNVDTPVDRNLLVHKLKDKYM